MSSTPFKYPRTPHISGSCATSDDIVLKGSAGFLGDSFVVTEKMDGTNIVMTCDGMMTRSGNQPSSSWGYPLRSTWNMVARMIPDGLGICCEFLYWRKSVPYDSLTSDFLVFSMIDLDAGVVLDWNTTTMWTEDLDLHMVPVIGHENDYQSAVSQGHHHMKHKESEGIPIEGFVVRDAGKFPVPEFNQHVAKFVRSGFTGIRGNNGRNTVAG
mgnify:CR=1 FL=1